MTMEGMKKRDIDYSKDLPFIREVCPHLSEEELREAENRFVEFLKICLKIQYRIAEEKLKHKKEHVFDEKINSDYDKDEGNC